MSLGLGLLTPVTHLRIPPIVSSELHKNHVGAARDPHFIEKGKDLLRVTGAQAGQDLGLLCTGLVVVSTRLSPRVRSHREECTGRPSGWGELYTALPPRNIM